MKSNLASPLMLVFAIGLLVTVCLVALLFGLGSRLGVFSMASFIHPVPVKSLPTHADNSTRPAQSSMPSLSNLHMATDDQGVHRTISYSPADAFNLFFDVGGVSKGTTFEARWYALNIAGKDPQIPIETMDQIYDGVSTTLRFHLTNTEPWPAGQYRVDIYMSGNKVGEVPFSVP